MWGIHESGMGPYGPRVRRKRTPLMGLYPPRTALWSYGLGFPYRGGRCRPEKARIASSIVRSFRYVERPLDRG